MLSFEKNCEIILFRSLAMVSENTPKIMVIGPPIMEKRPFKKLKILLFLPPFISKTKIVDIFNFPSLKCFGYCLSFLNIWHISLNYCWNFDPRTIKWRPFEIFAKLNGKDILLAVFDKFAEYQSNVLTEMHNFG